MFEVSVHHFDRRKFLRADSRRDFCNRPKNYFVHGQAFESMWPATWGQAGWECFVGVGREARLSGMWTTSESAGGPNTTARVIYACHIHAVFRVRVLTSLDSEPAGLSRSLLVKGAATRLARSRSPLYNPVAPKHLAISCTLAKTQTYLPAERENPS